MTTVSNDGIITTVRGDSFEFPLFINMGTPVSPVRYYIAEHENAKVFFGVMAPNQPFEKAFIKKIYTKDDINKEGDVVVKFIPKDTWYIRKGTYYYEVKLQDSEGVVTVIPKTLFHITD